MKPNFQELGVPPNEAKDCSLSVSDALTAYKERPKSAPATSSSSAVNDPKPFVITSK